MTERKTVKVTIPKNIFELAWNTRKPNQTRDARIEELIKNGFRIEG